MNPNNIETTEAVFRRLDQGYPEWVLFVPVVCALVVLFMTIFYRQPEPLSKLLKSISIPPQLVVIGMIVYAIYALLFTIVFVTLALAGVITKPTLPLMAAIPLIGYPVLLAILTLVILVSRKPALLIPIFIVGLLCAAYLLISLAFPGRSWWVILGPVLAVALFYVGMMYWQDMKTIHPIWAIFLGLLRVTVYGILCFIFLLPGCQEVRVRTTTSKVLVLFDVSDSMRLNKQVTAKGKKGKALTRTEELLAFLDKDLQAKGKKGGEAEEEGEPKKFLDQVADVTNVSGYRFGAVLDDANIIHLLKGGQAAPKSVTNDEKFTMKAWLTPDVSDVRLPKDYGDDAGGEKERKKKRKALREKLKTMYESLRSGTDVSGPALNAAIRESAHDIQAIIIFSDGQNTAGSRKSYSDLRDLVRDSKKPIHIITVGIGEYIPPVSIEVQGIQAPKVARPDDKFPVIVGAVGKGLAGQPFKVNLKMSEYREVPIGGGEYKLVPTGFTKTVSDDGKFKGGGDAPYGEVKFEIDIAKMKGVDPTDDEALKNLKSIWKFEAEVPPHVKEKTKEVHKSRPTEVRVLLRKLRVLLFAGGPTREYRFVRTLFTREVQESRMDLSIYLQTGKGENVAQDVESEKLLRSFPSGLGKRVGDTSIPALNEFDVVIAFDPNWQELTNKQWENIHEWVTTGAGGLIVVAGPIYTYQLSTPAGRPQKVFVDLAGMLPVVPLDVRRFRFDPKHDTRRPWTLKFAPNAKLFDFLNIAEDEKKKKTKKKAKLDGGPPQGWNDFFWEGDEPEPGKTPWGGFYNYYPVERVHPQATVLARFNGPRLTRVKLDDTLQPYIATMKVGVGRTVYLGSGEFWRLRQYDEEFHQRFWVKLARYAGALRTNRITENGTILMARKARTGQVNFTVRLLKNGVDPVPDTERPKVLVNLPENFDKADKLTNRVIVMQPRPVQPGDKFRGWFTGNFQVFTEGTYVLKVPVPGSPGKYLPPHTIEIYKPDPERENKKPDHGYLYQLASYADPAFKNVPDKKEELETVLKRNLNLAGGKDGESASTRLKLYFPLKDAKYIPDLLVVRPPATNTNKGGVYDLLNSGVKAGPIDVTMAHLLLVIPPLLLLIVMGVLFGFRQYVAGMIVFVLMLLQISGMVTLMVLGALPEWETLFTLDLSAVSAYWLWIIVPASILLLIAGILATIRNFLWALVVFAVAAIIPLFIFVLDMILKPTWAELSIDLSFILVGIVGLLALEWVCRKLLRLA